MKTIIPFGDRILVKREKVGGTIGKENIIQTADNTKEALTEIAEVRYVPDHTFIDKILIEDSEGFVKALAEKVKEHGDSEAMMSLLRFNDYLRVKSIQVGDKVMISKYVGIQFNDNFNEGDMTLCDSSDIIGIIK